MNTVEGEGLSVSFRSPQKPSYLYVKCPWCGDDFKQIISHHNVTTSEAENMSDHIYLMYIV